MFQAPTLVADQPAGADAPAPAPWGRGAVICPAPRASIEDQHRGEYAATDHTGDLFERPAATVDGSDVGLAVRLDVHRVWAADTPCVDHPWPPDLDSASDCERCGLAYQEWSV